jgi:hypothetical protein
MDGASSAPPQANSVDIESDTIKKTKPLRAE